MVLEQSHAEVVDTALRAALAGNAIEPSLVARCLADEVVVLRKKLAKVESAFDAADGEAARLRATVEAQRAATAELREKLQNSYPVLARAVEVQTGRDRRWGGSLIARRVANYILKGGA